MSVRPSCFSRVVTTAAGVVAAWGLITTSKRTDATVTYLVLAAVAITVGIILTTEDSLITIFTETRGQDPNSKSYINYVCMFWRFVINISVDHSINIASLQYCTLYISSCCAWHSCYTPCSDTTSCCLAILCTFCVHLPQYTTTNNSFSQSCTIQSWSLVTLGCIIANV